MALCKKNMVTGTDMEKLFDRGYQMAREGYPWEKAPPGFIVNPE